MKKICLLSAVVLLSSLCLVAQTTTGSSSQSDNNMHKTTVEGCLGGSAGSYTLTEKSGKEFDLQGDSSKLSDHVGQEVRITGAETKPSNSAGSTSSTSGSTSNSTSKRSIDVTNVEKVSDTCATK